MVLSLRQPAFRTAVVVLAVLMAVPANAQVGGTPAPPVTIWQFLGIPQGVKKLQGATRNRRGNHPNLEPKPPMRALADPRNLESPDPSIKKAAEVKTAEDLKRQKVKAVKYLASVGCGCYDADGGVTAALVASMQDCTEDVRYETIKAISEATEQGACARCGQGCCCNKDILTTLAKLAYERGDDGCYLEASERVRDAAREALVNCCPNDSPPMIVAEEPAPMQEEREAGEEIQEDESREAAPLPPGSLPTPPPSPPTALPSAQIVPEGELYSQSAAVTSNRLVVPQGNGSGESYEFGVVVHVSQQQGLAHVHFSESDLMLDEGSTLGVYAQNGSQRELLAKLQVVQGFPGSANVTGSNESLARIARGDIVLRAPAASAAQSRESIRAAWASGQQEALAASTQQVEFTEPTLPPQAQPATTPAPAQLKPARKVHAASRPLQKAATADRGTYTGFVR
jgi:hypothetical protein